MNWQYPLGYLFAKGKLVTHLVENGRALCGSKKSFAARSSEYVRDIDKCKKCIAKQAKGEA